MDIEEYLVTEDIQRIFKLKSPKSARALMRTEGFPTMRLGAKYLVLPSERTAWMKRNRTGNITLK